MLDTEFELVNSYSLGSTPGSIGLSNASDVSAYLNPLQIPISGGNHLISPKTIAFIDSTVSDALTVASNLDADIKVILDPTRDGISQITEVLSHYDGLTGVEIISHGNAATLQLGNSLLNQNSLQQYSSALQQWSSSLTSNADILLYGCNIASDAFGQAFVNNLSVLTGADVAASTNPTGNSFKGGDWTLEYTTGSIETAIPFGEALTSTYQGLFPSLFTSQLPTDANVTDGVGSAGDYELGMEFTSTKAGQIEAIRYYKAPSETDSHIGNIWSSTGTLLASVTFTNETASGWQEQTLASPLTIQPNTTYVVSVNANSYFALTPNGLTTTIANGDLSAIADGSNGVINPTPGLFPTLSPGNSNYFRDVVFTTSSTTALKDSATIFVSEAAGFATVTAVRTGNTQEQVTLEYTVNEVGGTEAATAGEDFTQPIFQGTTNTGQIVFDIGESEKTFTIPIVNDGLTEGTETFAVGIQNPSAGNLGAPRTVLLRIVDDDSPSTISMSDATITVSEGIPTATLTVQRSGSFTGPASINFNTSNGSASSGLDYTITSGTINFAAGQVTQTIVIPLVNDNITESNETFEVILSSPTGAILGSQTTSAITILDNDLNLGNLTRTTAVTGLDLPTAFDWTPDGRYMLVAQKNGIVKVVDNGTLRTTPLIDLSSEVNDAVDRGLLGIAIDPNFASTPYVYLLYTYDPSETLGNTGLAGPDGEGNRPARLVRVSVNPITMIADLGSLVVLVGTNSTWAYTSHPELDSTGNVNILPSGIVNGSNITAPASQIDEGSQDNDPGTIGIQNQNIRDYLAGDSLSHSIGAVQFGPDGFLYLSVGDGTSYNFVDPRAVRVQDINNLSGKVLRIDPTTGAGVAGNPFYEASDPNSNQSKVFYSGIRNAFRFTFDPLTNLPVIGDVGWTTWEEINTGAPGSNFGWPYLEGPNPTGSYQDLSQAISFYNNGNRNNVSDSAAVFPILARSHGAPDFANAIQVGDFYNSNTLLFGDIINGTVYAATLNSSRQITNVQVVDSNIPYVVDIEVGPDGNLYGLNLITGEILRWNNLVNTPSTSQSVFAPTATPTVANISDGVGSAGDYELGMEFTSTKEGLISAIRYYKAASETGPHVGKIWSSTGQLLASVNFTNESASGWQEQVLPNSLTIQPNTTYVVSVNANSYFAMTPNGLATTITNGDLSAVADGSNGLVNITPGLFPTLSPGNSNYFRDIVFTPSSNPSNHIGTVAVSGTAAQNQTLTANVNDIDGLTVGTTINYQWQQSTDNGATWSNIFGATNQTLLLTQAQVNNLVRVTATYSDALSNSENVISAATNPINSSGGGQPASLFTTQIPSTLNVTDGVGSAGDYELGMEFTSTKEGLISAIRYYKAASETGPHVGKIWSSTGQLLASVNFIWESASGWQQQALTTPLAISANTTYVVSVNANSYFAITPNGLATTITNGDLSAVADGSNGLVNITPGLFPTLSPGNSNYFRDIVFTPSANPSNHVGTITIGGTAAQNQTLTANVNDIDGLTVGTTINYQWQQSADNGTTWSNIFGATSQTLLLTQAQVNNLVRATATYTDTLGTKESVISNVTTITNINDPGLAILAGSATTGASLKANILDADGLTGATINYQWQQLVNSAWTNISGATAISLTLGNVLLNQVVRVTASYIDALGGIENNIVSSEVSIQAQNAIVLENQKVGTTAWQLANTATNDEISGYGDATSINKGQAINLKISLAQAGQYNLDVYRLGYYGGAGGRLITSVTGLNGVTQSGPTEDSTTGLVEYNWNISHTLQTGADWTSGLYFVKLTDITTGKQSYIQFVLRDDNRPADIGFQDAIATAQAYNTYGSNSVYNFNSEGGQRAYQVSFDRPFKYGPYDTSAQFNTLTWEYNMTRWIESQGYDVSYYTNLDVHSNPLQLYSQKTFLSVGHDEYWSREMFNNVEQARDNGTNLAFFSANTAYWQVRFDPSTSGQANRVMTVYKDTTGTGFGPSVDPIAQSNPAAATTLFRSPEVNRPENSLLGVGYIGDIGSGGLYQGFDFVVSNASDPYYANTGLQNGDKLIGLVGLEWDGLLNNGFTPTGLVVLSQSPVTPTGVPSVPPGTNTNVSNAVRYTASSGAKVFSTGSIQWVWGLDSYGVLNPRVDPRAQQIAVNIFADMGAKPQTPNSGIVVP
jgi:glucose/arabinose dehydrogenase